MLKPLFPVAVMTALLMGAQLVSASDSPVGKWSSVEEKSGKVESEIELYAQGDKLFGKITSLTEPNDKDGKPKTCTKCAAPETGQPIVGLVILRDLSLSGDRYKGGTILDPKDGKVYKAEVWVQDGKLKVRGYRGALYRTQTWVKAN